MGLNKVISFVVVLSLMFCVSACKNNEDSSKNKELAKIVGTVGDEKISEAEFMFYFNMNKTKMENDAGIEGKSDEQKKEFWATNDESQDKKQALIDKTFNDITDVKTLLMLAEKEKVELEQADLDEIESNVQRFIKERGNGDKAEAEKVMKEIYGITIDEYRWIYEDYLNAYDKYAFNETAKIEISDSDIEKRFEQDKDQYKKFNVKHVLIYTIDVNTKEPLTEDVTNQRKLLAEDVYKRVKEGEAIEDLAKQYSGDIGSKDSGGEYTLGKGDTVAEFEEWAFNAKEGDIGFIETSYGFHIIKFIKNVEASLGDKEKNTIMRYLQNEQFTDKVEVMKEKYPLVKNQEILDSLDLF